MYTFGNNFVYTTGMHLQADVIVFSLIFRKANRKVVVHTYLCHNEVAICVSIAVAIFYLPPRTL